MTFLRDVDKNKQIVESLGVKVGDKVRIVGMADTCQYDGKVGVITSIDESYNLFGTWGSLSIIPSEDDFVILG